MFLYLRLIALKPRSIYEFMKKMSAKVVLLLFSALLSVSALPLFNWKTVPVFAYVANYSGPINSQAVSALTKYKMVTVGKGQGIYDPTDNRVAEKKMFDAAKAIKTANKNVTVLAAFDALLTWPVYHFSAMVNGHPLWYLRNDTGSIIRLHGSATFPQPSAGMIAPDYTNTSAPRALIESCYNLTGSYVSGCFIDNMANITSWGNMGLGPTRAAAWLDAKAQTVTDLQSQLGENATLMLSNQMLPNVTSTFFPTYNASLYWIKQHQAAVRGGYVVAARAGLARDGTDNFCANITNSLSAFLIVAARQSYYACATNYSLNPSWPAQSDQWLDLRPEYRRPLGAPNGTAKYANNVFTRQFATGTRVYFNISSKAGLITWNGAEQQGDVSIAAGVQNFGDSEWIDIDEALQML